MKKVIDVLYYGGVSPAQRGKIYSDIEESNRKSVIAYSLISMIAFIAMTLFAKSSQNAVSRNWMFYIIGAVLMLLMLALNMTVAKQRRRITHITAYAFELVIMAIGILLAISGKDDVTASFMVFLFVAPLLFTLRPLFVIFTIIGSDVCYVAIMHAIQTPELFQKNIVNAVIYGLVSIFVSTVMTRMRIQKFETDYLNRILMDTDQLTGLLNRRSFEQHVERIRKSGNMAGTKVCAFDVNGLKQVNDNIGHHAGDELLRGAAACIEHVFSKYGYCYRTGGDEFIAILKDASPEPDELNILLDRQTVSFKGTYVPSLSISVGIAVGTINDSIDELLRQADALMYEHKAEYYKQKENDRRKR